MEDDNVGEIKCFNCGNPLTTARPEAEEGGVIGLCDKCVNKSDLIEDLKKKLPGKKADGSTRSRIAAL